MPAMSVPHGLFATVPLICYVDSHRRVHCVVRSLSFSRVVGWQSRHSWHMPLHTDSLLSRDGRKLIMRQRAEESHPGLRCYDWPYRRGGHEDRLFRSDTICRRSRWRQPPSTDRLDAADEPANDSGWDVPDPWSDLALVDVDLGLVGPNAWGQAMNLTGSSSGPVLTSRLRSCRLQIYLTPAPLPTAKSLSTSQLSVTITTSSALSGFHITLFSLNLSRFPGFRPLQGDSADDGDASFAHVPNMVPVPHICAILVQTLQPYVAIL